MNTAEKVVRVPTKLSLEVTFQPEPHFTALSPLYPTPCVYLWPCLNDHHRPRIDPFRLLFCVFQLSGFLAGAFSRCQDELQSVRRRAGKVDVALALKALEATKAQLVNFSATCLMEVSNSRM